MSDDPDRYRFGIEEPVRPFIVMAITIPALFIAAALILGTWWF